MRIAIPSFVLQGGKSGVAKYLMTLISTLSQIDHENSYKIYLGSHEQSLIEITNPAFCKELSSPFETQPVNNILWHNIMLPYFCLKHKIDLIHVPSYRRIPMVKTCPLIATVHDMAAFHMPEKYGKARKIFNLHLVPRMINRCDHIITVSQFSKSDIIKYCDYPEEKISVIYSGIDHSIYCPLDKQKTKNSIRNKYSIERDFFVYVSRLEHPAKNHIRLIEAYEQLNKQNREIDLVFAGADWHGSEIIHQRIKASKYSDRIHSLGFVSNDDVARLYNASIGMVSPSLFEGFGFPLLEAFACKTPVACSRTSSLIELAGANRAILFDPMSINELTKSLEELSKQSDIALIESNYQYSQNFQWDQTAKDVIRLYKMLLKES